MNLVRGYVAQLRYDGIPALTGKQASQLLEAAMDFSARRAGYVRILADGCSLLSTIVVKRWPNGVSQDAQYGALAVESIVPLARR